MVVTASERAARALASQLHRARRAEGLPAWITPQIHDWRSFVHRQWQERCFQGQMVLNPLQERSLWTEILTSAAPQATQIAGSCQRLAALAMEAQNLLCGYAPQRLEITARRGWTQDAGEFSNWLAAFDRSCRDEAVVSPTRLPIALAAALESDPGPRPPLLLAGFDRILPIQHRVFTAWGSVQEASPGEPAANLHFHAAADPSAELAACALWCKQQLANDPQSRLLIVTQDARERRGEIERAFLRYAGIAAHQCEFSLGRPLNQIALARGALLLLRWLTRPVEEHELDWFFSTGLTSASDSETLAVTEFQRALRRRGLQRTQWPMDDFLRQHAGVELPATWVARLTQARRLLQEFSRRPQSPLTFAGLVPNLLEAAGWPEARPLASAEFQALELWQRTVDHCASLGCNGRQIAWHEFLDALQLAASETLFAAESQDAPILIAGPAESAGLTADAIWFLGASEESWPAPGSTHPLLPLAVQREAAMPHATAQLDWDLAAAMTRRLLSSAPQIHFSYARQSEGVEARPSRLIAQFAGPPQPLPLELAPPPVPAPLAISFDDASQIPFPASRVAGGAGLLTAQSQCPFKAFANARLGAEDWQAAEAGLTAAERGQLLHAILHSVWSGEPGGIRTHAQLAAIHDLPKFVAGHVRAVVQHKLPARARECMPPSYLELEETRLTRLVTLWLRYESARIAFAVEATEQKRIATIAGLQLNLRLDRVDRLCDGTVFVIDYKTGDASPRNWDLPRPEDVQLPLYAGFAFDHEAEPVGGLAFAKIRAGESNFKFAGRLFDPQNTLFAALQGTSTLVKNKLSLEQIIDWRDCITQLARDFLAGLAEVNPRKAPQTCRHCGLQSLCRILEAPSRDEEIEEESADD